MKCDEQKPQCRRCIDYGMECPGYRPSAEKDLHFVDETKSVARKSGNEVFQQQPTNEHVIRKYHWRNQSYAPTKSYGPSDINKNHVHRVQLLSTFLDLYLPKRNDKTLTSNFSYIASLPQIDLSSPLLQVSIDCLCLAELGSLYQDERCQREAQARYVRALPMLSNELARPPSKRMRSEHILAAITILALCELFGVIARGNGNRQGWISHVSGAQQYIKAIGPKGIDSDFAWLLFHNVRHSSMCMGFVKRQAVLFAELQWLKVTAGLAKYDQYVALYDIALQIPGALEEVDKLPHTDSVRSDYVSTCTDICRLRKALECWLQKFYIERSIEIYDIVDVRDMKEFAHLCLDRTFQTVFSFDSVQSCSQLQLYWISLLILDFTLLAVHRPLLFAGSSSQVRIHDFTSRTENDIERDMFVAATSYCRSVPFCCEPESASVGRIGTFLIRIVQNYFEQCGHCRELEWCRAVRQMLQSYSESPAKAKHETGDVPGAPWNVTHKCKSPICNFRVECVAPAPLLLAGEYPSKTYTPRHDSREVNFDQVFPEQKPSQDPEERAFADSMATARKHARRLKQGYWRSAVGQQRSLDQTVLKENGTSALADERVVTEGFVPSIET